MSIPELPPQTLVKHRYRIETVLGQGGFGRTYLAKDQDSFDKRCVLKEFAPQSLGTYGLQKSRELFEREAKTLYQLEHPQIPKFLAWFEEGDRLFLVQEYVDGQTYWSLLQNRLQQGQTFSEAEIRKWLKDVLPILDYIHGLGIIHRDISPDNIMLPQRSALPILIDFGVVHQIATQLPANGLSLSPSQQTSVVGKTGYAPPEQIRTGQCYENSDLYALGVTALVLLTGKEPNALFNPQEGEWQWEPEVQLSQELGDILRKLLAERPKDRYGSAQSVLAALAIQGRSAPATRVILPKPSSSHRSSATGSKTVVHSVLPTIPPSPPAISVKPPSGLRSPFILPLLIAGGILGLGALGATQLSPICQWFNTCSATRPAPSPNSSPIAAPSSSIDPDQQRYTAAVTLATTAQALATKAQTLADLKNATQRLEDAIAQLQTIPPTSSFYPQAQSQIATYTTQLSEWTTQLTQETKAQQLLDQAEAKAKTATVQGSSAQSIAALTGVQQVWQRAIAQAESIPDQSLVAPLATTRLTQYRQSLKTVEARLAQTRQRLEAERIVQQQALQSSRSTSQAPSSYHTSPESNDTYNPPPVPKPVTPAEPLWGAPTTPSRTQPTQKEPLW